MTTRKEKVLQLRRHIAKQLDDMIDRDYVLFGLPYYLNIGDILIWEGERQYFNRFRHKCINEGYHYRDYWRIKGNTLIVLQGGGNFGDLWRFIQEERLSIVQRYMNNPIIISPVTCWYENTVLLRQDAEIFSKHPNLTICARDALSFALLKKHFNKNQILLVPDMAFCIDRAGIERYVHNERKETLFLKRTDKELGLNSPLIPKEVLDKADVHDWPSMERDPLCWIRYRRLHDYGKKVEHYKGLRAISRVILKSSDWYFHERCRKHLIQEGASFLSQYCNIYTTRLHVGILSILLDKSVTFIDNSYGKNLSFFETWLNDTDGVRFLRSE